MKNKCGDCEKVWEDAELVEIHNLTQRMEPGDTYPSGECPGCGALCTPVEEARPRPITIDYKLLAFQYSVLTAVMDSTDDTDMADLAANHSDELEGIEELLSEIIHQRPFPEVSHA